MTDRPILFSAPMVRALLDGRKTQTRRIARRPTDHFHADYTEPVIVDGRAYWTGRSGSRRPIPRCHAIGDRLWVRESGATITHADDHDQWTGKDIRGVHGWKHSADGAIIEYAGNKPSEYLGDCSLTSRPSIHMPRWASRLTLVVTDVRMQRLQEISEQDAISEGVEAAGEGWVDYQLEGLEAPTAKWSFGTLWESINGTGAWAANPWVAAYSFSVHRCNIDEMGTP